MWKTTITDCWRDGLSRDEQKELSERVRNLMMETYARNKELI